MTRQKSCPNTPDFEIVDYPVNLKAYCWKGVSAFLLDDEETGNKVVLTAPDEDQLKFFWNKLSKDPVNMSMVKTTIGDYAFAEKIAEEPVSRSSRRRTTVVEEPLYYCQSLTDNEILHKDNPIPDLNFILKNPPPFEEIPSYIMENKIGFEPIAIYRWHRGRKTWMKI